MIEKINMVCIKECEAYSNWFFKIKVGEIVEWYSNSILKSQQKSEVVFRNGIDLTLIDIKDFQECFISLAEWRDKQINSILYDDTEGE